MKQIDKKTIVKFIKFGIVGVSGIFVNSGVLWFVHDFINIPLAIASLFAVGLSILTNFIFNDFWTWGENKTNRQHSYVHRLWRYYISASLGSGINYVVLLVLTHMFGIYYLIANLAGIFAGMFSNFILGERWVFKSKSIDN